MICTFSYTATSDRKVYLKEWQRKYRKTDKSKAYDKAFRKQYVKTLRGLASKLFSSAKRRATEGDLLFTITPEWVLDHLQPLICEATGLKLSLEIDENSQHTYNRPSLDRKDNRLGYTPDNCQVVAVIYNKAKSDGLHAHVLEMSLALMEKK